MKPRKSEIENSWATFLKKFILQGYGSQQDLSQAVAPNPLDLLKLLQRRIS